MTEQTEIIINDNGHEKRITEKDFTGKSKTSAQNTAEKNNLIFRLIEINGKPMFSMPTDKRTDRVCVWIENSEVVKVIFT